MWKNGWKNIRRNDCVQSYGMTKTHWIKEDHEQSCLQRNTKTKGMTKGKVKVGADKKSSHTQTEAFHVAWDKESGDNETKIREKRRFARTRRRTAASAAKETAEAKRKRQSVAKICAAAKQQRKTKKVKEKKIRTSFSSCYEKHEINARKWKNRRNDMWSLKDTDGMQCCWTRLGDLPHSKFGRHITNTYVGAGKHEHKHGVGILLHRKWRHHNNDRGQLSTHHAGQRVLHPLGICRSSHWKNVQNNREAHEFQQKGHTDCWRRFQRWFEALGLVSSESVLDRTHSKRVAKEKIGWSNGWWYRTSQHSTRCAETLGKRTTHRSRKGTEQQIDYTLIKRRHLKYNKDAEAKDMIHMGSDHRCVMATFRHQHQKRIHTHDANKDNRRITKQIIRTQTDQKDREKELSTFEKRYQELEVKIKQKAEAANSDLKQNKERTSQGRWKLKQKKKMKSKQ